MLEKVKGVFGFPTTRPVFVIGTGRSGTHWLGYSLGTHQEIRATVEVEPMFSLSTRMALNPTLEKKLFKRLVAAYKWQLFKSSTPLYLDKSHPNIWIAEKLKENFPESLFVAIERNPFATVASMMKHKGVSAWHKRWREFPIPNRFLGISEEQSHVYDTIPFASQCAMRWVAHHNKIKELKSILEEDLFLISHESFAHNTEQVIQELQQFLGLHYPIPLPNVKIESLDKWKIDLSDQELMHIQNIVGFSPDTINNGERSI
jgi:hypothetical protein